MSVRKRPGGVTAVAIINIVLGSLALLGGVCSVFAVFMSQEFIQADPNAGAMEAFLRQQLPLHDVMQWGGIIIMVLQGVALLVTGIGLLNMQNWARVTAIWCAVLSLLWIFIQAFYYFAYSLPVLDRFFRDFGGQAGPGPNPRMIVTITTAVQIILWLLLIAYAIILISVLTRRHVREIYTDTAAPEEDFDRYQEEDADWHEKRRQRDDGEDEDGGQGEFGIQNPR